jgi:hypothetical protein
MDAWLRMAMRDPGGRQRRVVLIPRCWDQACEMAMSALTGPTRRAGDGGYQSPDTGESAQ